MKTTTSGDHCMTFWSGCNKPHLSKSLSFRNTFFEWPYISQFSILRSFLNASASIWWSVACAHTWTPIHPWVHLLVSNPVPRTINFSTYANMDIWYLLINYHSSVLGPINLLKEGERNWSAWPMTIMLGMENCRIHIHVKRYINQRLCAY